MFGNVWTILRFGKNQIKPNRSDLNLNSDAALNLPTAGLQLKLQTILLKQVL